MKYVTAALALALALPAFAPAVAQDEAEAPEVPEMVVEIYRIAPGQHAAFLEAIATYDEVNRRAGLPPRQLYVHSSGASWDFMLIQPASTPDENRAALDAAWDEMDLPSGPDFFIEFRHYVAEHTDTFVSGPTTAADYLGRRERD